MKSQTWPDYPKSETREDQVRALLARHDEKIQAVLESARAFARDQRKARNPSSGTGTRTPEVFPARDILPL